MKMFCMPTYNGVATVSRQEDSMVSTLRVINDDFGNQAVAVLTQPQAVKLARALLDSIGFNFDDDTETQLDNLENL